jgi:uncharacterized protein (TIGR00730 family)
MKNIKFSNNKKYFLKPDWTVNKVKDEINRGLRLLNGINQPIVTILGSHRSKPGSRYFEHARKLGMALGEKGYAVATGGGPGIMEAANQGASDVGAVSVGIKARLLKEERIASKIFTKQISYHFLFVRRFILSIKSDALVFFPGAYGTLNELFEFIVLMQINYVDRVPLICVDRKYWKGLFQWVQKEPARHNFFINAKRDLKLVEFADTNDEILKIIQRKK